MDKKVLVKKLHDVFCESNKGEKKYSQVWLSQLDYGGLYYSNDFVLKLKTEHKIERHLTEISQVIKLLGEKAKEEAKSILRVVVYGPNDKAECESEDYLIYDGETACI